MVKSLKIIALLLIFSFSAEAQTGTVLFKVKGIKSAKGGNLSSGIFIEENFPEVGKQFMGKDVKVEGDEMEILLENVPVGTYGAVVFQDTDSDQELDSNFMGFPKEPIGFANNAKIRFGPPKFKDAAISVKAGEIVIVEINLK